MCGAWLAMLWERGGNRNAGLRILCLPPLIIMIINDTAYGGLRYTTFGGFEELVRVVG
jgi:hypothetical protein